MRLHFDRRSRDVVVTGVFPRALLGAVDSSRRDHPSVEPLDGSTWHVLGRGRLDCSVDVRSRNQATEDLGGRSPP